MPTQAIDNMLNTVIHGDNLEVMRTMPDNYVDTVITDPPAGIGFMGKSWDKAKGGRDQWIAWLAEIMAECLRVTKPGGVLLCWSIPRTSHWTGMAIENAGWQIVDKIAHLFGSGFPKSLDISKAIDKGVAADGDRLIDKLRELQNVLNQKRQTNNLTLKDMNRILGAPENSGLAAHKFCDKTQPQFLTRKQFEILKPLLGLGEYEDQMFDRIEREIVGQGKAGLTKGEICTFAGTPEFDITTPATPLAKLWHGWGTALKPSREDWYLAYKPVDGTYAANAERWGVAGLWIDGGRISGEPTPINKLKNWSGFGQEIKPEYEAQINTKGRFPSNTILSCTCGDIEPWEEWIAKTGNHGGTRREWESLKTAHTADCPVRMLDEQSGIRPAGGKVTGRQASRTGDTGIYGHYEGKENSPFYDSGGASRFFYCAKSSRAERNAGCEGMEYGPPPASARSQPADGRQTALGLPRQNHHPTVKPLALMEYFCNLTKTPTGGVVLDPFAGSGTTGKAAYRTGRDYILIEKEIESVEIARARIHHEQELMGLFPESGQGE